MALRTKSNFHLGCRTGCRTKIGLCHQTVRIVCASGARPGRPCIVRNRRRRIDGRAESRSFLRAYFRTSPSHHRPTGIGAPRAARRRHSCSCWTRPPSPFPKVVPSLDLIKCTHATVIKAVRDTPLHAQCNIDHRRSSAGYGRSMVAAFSTRPSSSSRNRCSSSSSLRRASRS